MDAHRPPPRPHGAGRWTGLAAALAVLGTALALSTPSHAAGPTLAFGYAPVVPLVGQTVTFTAVGAPGTNAAIASYRWDLDGDGSYELNTGTTPVATATYSTADTITVSVQLRDSFDDRVTLSRVLTVGGQAPLASFTVAPARPVVSEPVTFTSHSSDPDGTLAEQAWDLDGNGVFDNGGGSPAIRTFTAAGQYVIGLRVTDNEGHASYSSRTLTVHSGILHLLNPFPVVRISGTLTPRGVRLRLVAVSAPAGATVRVRCAGRTCPFRRRVRYASSTSDRIRFQGLETSLQAGVRIRIYVTSPGTIGKYTVFTIRRGKQPRREDSCVLHGSSTPVACRAR